MVWAALGTWWDYGHASSCIPRAGAAFRAGGSSRGAHASPRITPTSELRRGRTDLKFRVQAAGWQPRGGDDRREPPLSVGDLPGTSRRGAARGDGLGSPAPCRGPTPPSPRLVFRQGAGIPGICKELPGGWRQGREEGKSGKPPAIRTIWSRSLGAAVSGIKELIENRHCLRQ